MITGVDFGSKCTKAAVLDETGKPVSVLNSRGEPTTPSVVYYPPDGKPLVGVDALEQSYLAPERCVLYPKLKLGTTENLLGSGLVVTATDAVKQQIAAVKEDVERQYHTEVTYCVATCPANFRDNAKQALLETCSANGIEVLALKPEPTMAGVAYAAERGGNGQLFGVYDFGGGTFDFSLLKVDGGQLTVLATQGVPQLGGQDLNACITRRISDAVKSELGIEPTRESHPLFFLDLEQRVEQAKLSLGQRDKVPLVVALDGRQVVVALSRSQFHADIDPLVDQSLQAMDAALKSAGMSYSKVHRLIMVGGTSRSPHVQDRVAQHTGLAPKTDVHPEKAVAYGAALACGVELARRGETATLNGVVIPAPDLLISEVTAHAVGCCVLHRKKGKNHLINSVMIPKNTRIPCQHLEQFFLEHEDQIAAKIEILQGEPEADREQCLSIGELQLDGLPKEKKRTRRLQLEYVIDANGMVTVTASDKVSGKQKTVSVDYKKGIQSGGSR